MGNVEKDLPEELDDNSKYIVRVRSINNFGVASDWSESIGVNTEATTSVAGGRLVLTDSSIFGYDGNGKLTFGYFGDGITRTNLITNPSFETNIVGYDANAFTSLAATSTHARYGTDSLRLTTTAAASGIGFVQSSANRFSVIVGEDYTASLFVLNPTGNTEFSAKFGIEFFNAGGTSLGVKWSPQDIIIPVDDEWRRISVIAVEAPTDAVTGGLRFSTVTAIPNGTDIYIDAILVEKASILLEYFDGDSAGTKASWTGTAHASTSIITSNVGDVYIGGTLTIDGLDTDSIKTFYQDDPPTAENIGDIWIDSNDDDKMYRWDGSTWELVSDKVSTGTIISGNLIRTGTIQSELYSYTSGDFSNFGMQVVLDGNGSIRAKEFYLSDTGDAIFSGTISGGTIDIGGNDSTSFHVDSSGNMWLGASTYAAAPFKVSSAGALTATSGTFSGNVSGGEIHIGGFDSTSFHVSSSGSMWLGSGAYGTAPFRVSSTGSLTVTGASISGSNISGGSLNIGSGNFVVDSSGFVNVNNGMTLNTTITTPVRIQDDTDTSDHLSISVRSNFVEQYYNIDGFEGLLAWDPSINGFYIGGTATDVFTAGVTIGNFMRVAGNGSTGAAAIGWVPDTNTGFFRRAENDFAATAGGTQVMTWTSSTVYTLLPSVGSTSGHNYVLADGFGGLKRFTSTQEIKENILPVTDSGVIIDSLNPVTFNPKFIPTKNQPKEDEVYRILREADLNYGFIAEEIATVADGKLAQWKWTEEDGLKPNGWKWSDMIALLTAEVKSLRKRVQELEDR